MCSICAPACIYIQSLVHKCRSNAKQYSLSPLGSLQMVVLIEKRANQKCCKLWMLHTTARYNAAFMWEGRRMKRHPIIKQTAARTTKRERSSLTPVEISLFIDEGLGCQGEGEAWKRNWLVKTKNTVKTTFSSWREISRHWWKFKLPLSSLNVQSWRIYIAINREKNTKWLYSCILSIWVLWHGIRGGGSNFLVATWLCQVTIWVSPVWSNHKWKAPTRLKNEAKTARSPLETGSGVNLHS